MKKLKLAVLPGDGIGQDVMHAALPLFDVLNLPIELIVGDIGWECWKQNGNSVPTKTWGIIKSCDAVLLGATTSMPEKEAIKALPLHLQESPPLYVSPIVQLRQQLDLYANIRPCFNIMKKGEHFDFTVIRENTEGLYAGLDFYPLPDNLSNVIKANSRWQHVTSDEASCSLRLQSRHGLLRLFEYAFHYADKKKYNRVTFADKPNVLRKSSAFSRELFESVAQKYKHIQADIHNVDAVALWMVKRPQEFGVIVAENMFGDILSDLGAGVMGGLGLAASANIGINSCYFEPVHGSAPRVKPNSANPGAMFLTIGLLLEYFGYKKESELIKQSLEAVIRDGKFLTYDLGGTASTKIMAHAIIDHCLSPKNKQIVSFLATGNEIIQGEIQDGNSHAFSKMVTERGGSIYQHIHVSDIKREISSALSYLLNQSDAVIVTGGLGPTIDDMTRFAIADVIKQDLCFSEIAWTHVVSRLTRFNLTVTESNRQQALFPRDAELYQNENGTACGCHMAWQGKHIFMLPGPPKECYSMFDKFVIPTLEKLNFFQPKQCYRWLTLGLIEGEISSKIADMNLPASIEMAYRWSYPYLEIKLLTNEKEENTKLIEQIDALLSSYVVSRDGKNAIEMLNEALQHFDDNVALVDEVTAGDFEQSTAIQKLKYLIKKPHESMAGVWLHIMASQPLRDQIIYDGTVTLSCEGFSNNQIIYSHQLSIPNRGSEVLEYANAYIAWQIYQFIIFYKR